MMGEADLEVARKDKDAKGCIARASTGFAHKVLLDAFGTAS